jgi:hypothetical protein
MGFSTLLPLGFATAQFFVSPALPAPAQPTFRAPAEAMYAEVTVGGIPVAPVQTGQSGFAPAACVVVFALGVAAAVRPVAMFSHFSSIRTQFKDRKVLADALKDLGQVVEVCQDDPVSVRGHRGETQMAEIVVKQSNGYDIGFQRNANNEFELITDLVFWDQVVPADAFMERLSQRYAMNKVLALADEQDFNVLEQVTTTDGAIKIKLNRFAAV